MKRAKYALQYIARSQVSILFSSMWDAAPQSDAHWNLLLPSSSLVSLAIVYANKDNR